MSDSKKPSAKLFSEHFQCVFYNSSDFFSQLLKNFPIELRDKLKVEFLQTVFSNNFLWTLWRKIWQPSKKATKTSKAPCFWNIYSRVALPDTWKAELITMTTNFPQEARQIHARIAQKLKNSSGMKTADLTTLPEFFSGLRNCFTWTLRIPKIW